MMNRIQSLYFSFLRAAIMDTAPEFEDGSLSQEEWRDFMRVCTIQGTRALVSNQILKLDPATALAKSLPTDLAVYMKSACAQNMFSQQKLLSILSQTWKALEESTQHDAQPITPVLLKGFGLAQLYPQPYLREWGDLDVYVGPANYHRSAEILREAFPQALHINEEGEDLKHYNFNFPDGNVVEMHRVTVKMDHPRDEKVYHALELEAMRKNKLCWVDIEGVDTKIAVPAACFNVLFTFLHAWMHFVEEGVGMKQICDVALLTRWTSNHQSSIINQQSISAYLNTTLKKLKLWEPWQLMGYVCVHALGLRQEEWPLYRENAWLRKHGALFLNRIMMEGLHRPIELPDDCENKYQLRNKYRQLPWLRRKIKTIELRRAKAKFVKTFSPEYARHMNWTTMIHGLMRLIHREEMKIYEFV